MIVKHSNTVWLSNASRVLNSQLVDQQLGQNDAKITNISQSDDVMPYGNVQNFAETCSDD